MNDLLLLIIRAGLLLARPLSSTHGRRDERGDVPGWVLVTVMTAGLVMALWGLADDQLKQMLSNALNSVKG